MNTLGAKSLSTILARTPCTDSKCKHQQMEGVQYGGKNIVIPQGNQRRPAEKFHKVISDIPEQDTYQEFQIYLHESKFCSTSYSRDQLKIVLEINT